MSGASHPPHEGASVQAHREAAILRVPCAVVTVSDTRDLATDTGGALAVELLTGAGHPVVLREIVHDAPQEIAAAARRALGHPEVRAVVLTGGTGVAPRDVTPETLEPLLERVIPGFGELFRALSYEEIGAAAILSRATAGVARGKAVFLLPGSPPALDLAVTKLILPEIRHLLDQARRS